MLTTTASTTASTNLDVATQATAPLVNWWLPADCAGAGTALRDGVGLVADAAYHDAGAAFSAFVSVVGTTLIDLYADPASTRDWLGQLAASGGHCALLASEREAGSELDRMLTTAVQDGADLVLDGRKLFATNADEAELLVVLARAEPGAAAPFVAVVVPRDTPGVVIEQQWSTIGLRSSPVYQVTLRGCRVPAHHVLRGHGLRALEVGLNPSRILIAATAVGLSRQLRDRCLDFARERPLRGGTLGKHPVFAAKLAQVEVGIEAMRAVCLRAAEEHDAVMAAADAADRYARRGVLKSAAVAKLFCGQTGWQIASTASEVFGGLGYTEDLGIGQLLHDMRYVSLVEGGDDVLRDLVYRRHVVPPRQRA